LPREVVGKGLRFSLRHAPCAHIMTRRSVLVTSAAGLATWFGTSRWGSAAAEPFAVTHTDEEWRKLLTPDQYAVLRQSATERPFSSPLLKEHHPGIFDCAGCDQGLFSSETKFESGTGWPSFWAPLSEQVIGTTRDTTLGMIRVEVHCSRCGGHLGHVFNDGPKVTGLRYCMNGVAMIFKPAAA
jgi:peptide-methionine (R)-S-oxide reductase